MLTVGTSFSLVFIVAVQGLCGQSATSIPQTQIVLKHQKITTMEWMVFGCMPKSYGVVMIRIAIFSNYGTRCKSTKTH